MSSHHTAQAAMGFVHAMERPGCHACPHVMREPGAFNASPSPAKWWCTKGQFYTSATSICKYHPVMVQAAATDAQGEPA